MTARSSNLSGGLVGDRRLWALPIAAWTALVVGSLWWNLSETNRNARTVAQDTARAFFEEILTTRQWNAERSGVYVFANELTPPNPYLKDPDRDLYTNDGRQLTKVNPAYMTRGISEIAALRTGVRFHITSLKPIRPDNAPDAWEIEALRAFEDGQAEVMELLHTADGPSIYRFMAPLITEQVCLQCHAEQGYALGEIRGGISVAVPAAASLSALRRAQLDLVGLHGAVLFLGLVGISVFLGLSRRHLLALEAAQQQAEAANRSKGDYLAHMSHEIRTPMNGILGMVELTLRSDLTSDQRGYLEMAKVSANSLLRVVDDILDFEKIEAGKLDFEEIPFDLTSTVESALNVCAIPAHRKGLELVCDVDIEVPQAVHGDPGRLRQILINLLGNAVKFTRQGDVILRVAREEREAGDDGLWLSFAVTDTGVGISPERIGHLFSSFTQAERSTAREFGGSGLGLAISRRLVEQMGGTIGVQSRVGEGSTFSFSARFRVAEEGVAGVESLDETALAGLRLLIVVDSEAQRVALGHLVARLGAEAEAVPDSAEGIRAVRRAHDRGQPFDVALVDGLQREENGCHAAAAIDLESSHALPVVMLLTADRYLDSAARCRELGIAAYLQKPPSQVEIRLAVQRARQLRRPAGDPPETPMGEETHAGEAAAASSGGAPSPQVLLVEDNPINQSLLTTLLKLRGCAVTVAADGAEAIARWQIGSFDLIFMDVEMEGLDGLEATRRIRQLEAAHDGADRRDPVPVVAMTAHTSGDMHERCLEAGMDRYLTKPIDANGLGTLLDSLIAPRAGDEGGPADSPLDLERVREWLGGDARALQRILESFAHERREQLAELGAGLEAADAGRVRRAAHRLRGSLSTFGADRAASLAEAIEEVAQEGALDTVGALHAQLLEEMERVRAAVRDSEI